MYKRVKGISELNFCWYHYLADDRLLDPSPTNIIDFYILTRGYYTNLPNDSVLTVEISETQDFSSITGTITTSDFQRVDVRNILPPKSEGTFYVRTKLDSASTTKSSDYNYYTISFIEGVLITIEIDHGSTGTGITSPTVGVHETGRTFHMDFIPDEGSLIASYTIDGNTNPYGIEGSLGLDLAPVDGDSLISVLFDSIPLGPF
jgi:hypothetical protein